MYNYKRNVSLADQLRFIHALSHLYKELPNTLPDYCDYHLSLMKNPCYVVLLICRANRNKSVKIKHEHGESVQLTLISLK